MTGIASKQNEKKNIKRGDFWTFSVTNVNCLKIELKCMKKILHTIIFFYIKDKK